MAVLVAVIAFLAGAAVGAGVAVWWLGRRLAAGPPPAEASLDPASTQPVGEPAAVGEEADPDLKPILDATRGVLSDLEERYRGRRPGRPDS